LTAIEQRSHLGPYEVEIDTPLYGVILIGNGNPLMSNSLFSDKNRAFAYAESFDETGYVVTIKGTNT